MREVFCKSVLLECGSGGFQRGQIARTVSWKYMRTEWCLAGTRHYACRLLSETVPYLKGSVHQRRAVYVSAHSDVSTIMKRSKEHTIYITDALDGTIEVGPEK